MIHLQHNTSQNKRVVIVGGGIAGLAAALKLKQYNIPVTLLEATKHLGGRAASIPSNMTNSGLIDTCQHVVMGCCTNLLDFYQHLNVTDQIQWYNHTWFASTHNKHHTLRTASYLPAPLHQLPSFLRFHAFTIIERIAIIRAMRSIICTDRAQVHGTFEHWLQTHAEQSKQLIKRFWDLLVISACNATTDQIAAETGLQLLQDGFLAHRNAATIGIPKCPLTQLYNPMFDIIGDIRIGSRVSHFTGQQNTLDHPLTIKNVLLQNGSTVTGDVFICALPANIIANPPLFPPNVKQFDHRITQAAKLQYNPIISVHIWFDYTRIHKASFPPAGVTPKSAIWAFSLLDRPTQWVFFTNQSDSPDSIYHVQAVISAANDWINLDQNTIVNKVTQDLKHVLGNLPPIHTAQVFKSKHATFIPSPESQRQRINTSGTVPNLLFAGDYTQTGWPATMESAVRSGYLAATAAVHHLGLSSTKSINPSTIKPNLTPSRLYRYIKAIGEI